MKHRGNAERTAIDSATTRPAGGYGNRAEHAEALDDIPQNRSGNATIGDIINMRLGRRQLIKGMLGTVAASAAMGTFAPPPARATPKDRFNFQPLSAGIDETHHVAQGYDAQILLRWGDPVFADAPEFDPHQQTAESQLRQFGYNNDYVGFVPLDGSGARGLLCVNHEFTIEEMMFSNLRRQDKRKVSFADMTPELCKIEMAAHGATVIEIRREKNRWVPVLDSRYNRRISPLTTDMRIEGPAAGDARMKTSEDPSGRRVRGTVNNCAGGITAWGTYLMAEENFRFYFWRDEFAKTGEVCGSAKAKKSVERYGIGQRLQAWGKFADDPVHGKDLRRFNLAKEPNEPNRFGWIVEVDPFDPEAEPVKQTALGRFCHEGAESLINKDGRVVLYSGDDTRFEYVYRFVSRAKFAPGDRAANMRLLSDGTLSAARFNADGTLDWLPLIHDQGPLTSANGFDSQADVLIDTRLAADALGATCMDRPEDVQPNPVTGEVYVMLTNNKKRQPGQEDAANPRAPNPFGHVIEMTPPEGDHASDTFRWDMLVKCGDPFDPDIGAQWHKDITADGWFASPDNCAIDSEGRLWVATDQGRNWPKTKKADGLYALETQGAGRGLSTLFFRCPVGAELCGPTFSPDQETLFVAVQHPGTDGTEFYPGFERTSTFNDPATRWPDFKPDIPPRPSVVAITRSGGGKIG